MSKVSDLSSSTKMDGEMPVDKNSASPPSSPTNSNLPSSSSGVKFEVDIAVIRETVNKKFIVAAEALKADKVERPLRTLSYMYLCLKVDEQLERVQKSQGWLYNKVNRAICPQTPPPSSSSLMSGLVAPTAYLPVLPQPENGPVFIRVDT